MDKIEIKNKLFEIFKIVMGENTGDVLQYNDNSNLTDDLGLNSVGILYLVIAIEETFNIRFDDVGVADLKTVGQVVDYIQNKV